jgi:hypothetical protein
MSHEKHVACHMDVCKIVEDGGISLRLYMSRVCGFSREVYVLIPHPHNLEQWVIIRGILTSLGKFRVAFDCKARRKGGGGGNSLSCFISIVILVS